MTSLHITTRHEPHVLLPSAFLDHAHGALLDGDISEMGDLVATLNFIRRGLSAEDWQSYIGSTIAPHPIRALLHEEPFTQRAFAKPRGYAGDAPMLDLIYDEVPIGQLTTLGARLHSWARNQPAALSVRARRDMLAALIDRVAAERRAPRILSIACGHLREAQRSGAVQSGCVAEFVAIDQDRESLAVVDSEQRRNNVVAIHSTIRQLLINGVGPGQFDFVYAAGLYDYLEPAVARALTESMFRALRPGGRLLVPNFAPNLRDIGYMEAIMDWHLRYRTESEMVGFHARIPREQIADESFYRDEPGNVVYLELQKV